MYSFIAFGAFVIAMEFPAQDILGKAHAHVFQSIVDIHIDHL